MSMNITLRRITKLVSKIDDLLHEATTDVTNNVRKSVFIHDEQAVVEKQIGEAAATYRESMAKFVLLHTIRRQLREMVGNANSVQGVNTLVTELRTVESMLGFISNTRKHVAKDLRLSSAELQTRLDAFRRKGEKAQVEVSAWHPRGEPDTNMQQFSTLESGDVNRLQIQEKALKQRSEAISDQLERINASIELEVPESLEKMLKELELVSNAQTL